MDCPKKYFIWGACYSSQMLLYCIDLISNFCKFNDFICEGIIDINPKKQRKFFLNYKVVSPEEAFMVREAGIIISLSDSIFDEISAELSEKGFVYGKDYWNASDFLSYYMRQALHKVSKADTEAIYEKVLKKMFSYKRSNTHSYYMLTHITHDYFCNILVNESNQQNIIHFFEKINWYDVKDNENINLIRQNAKKFSKTNLSNDIVHKRNLNIAILKKSFPQCVSEYIEEILNKGRKQYFLIDDFHTIVVSDDSAYFITNLISVEFAVCFLDFQKKENHGWFEFVLHSLSRDIANSIYFKVEQNNKMSKKGLEIAHSIFPYSEIYEYLKGKQALDIKCYQDAKKWVSIGLQKRQFSEKLCELQGDLYMIDKDYLSAIKYYSRTALKNSTRDQLWMITNDGELNVDKAVRKKINECISKFSDQEKQKCADVISKEILVARSKFKEKKLIYVENKLVGIDNPNKGKVLDFETEIHKSIAGDVENEIKEYFRGDYYKDFCFSPYGRVCFLPIQRLSEAPINFEYKKIQLSYDDEINQNVQVCNTVFRFPIGQWRMLRIDNDIHINSEKEFVIGLPFFKESLEKKPKIVINIFIDALAFYRVKNAMNDFMPYTKSFFEKGCCFNNCYAVGEWTQTCYPSMFLGVDPIKLEGFQPRFMYEVPQMYKSIPERMRDIGYYCTAFCADAADIERFYIMGPDRGIDHQFMKNRLKIDFAIEKTIDMIEKIDGNLFFNIHALDIHDSHFEMGRVATSDFGTESEDFQKIMLSDAYVGTPEWGIDVSYDARELIYCKLLKNLDFKLQFLYNYLENKFSDDEMLVVLHSDHGAFGGSFPLSEEHTNIPLMLRGHGVNMINNYSNEIISGIDLYAIYEKIMEFPQNDYSDAILPQTFGGMGREYAVTHWRYPGQQYRLIIHKNKYQLFIETKEKTVTDGRICMDECRYIYIGEDECQDVNISDGISVCTNIIKTLDVGITD